MTDAHKAPHGLSLWMNKAEHVEHREEAPEGLPALPSPTLTADEAGSDLFSRPNSPDVRIHSPLLKPYPEGDLFDEAAEPEHEHENDDDEAGEETTMLRKASPPLDDGDELERALRRDRHVYGGVGRSRTVRGTLDIFEVAWEVAAACLPAAPLLMPHALHLSGLPVGLPVLFLVAALCWLSHCVLAIQGRYVGGFSLTHVADAVFPRKWYGRWIGEGVVDVWSVFVSGGRAIVVIGVSTQLMVDLALAVFPRFSVYYAVPVVVIILAVFSLIPSLLMPTKPLFPAGSYPFLARLPTWSISLYLLALLIVGVRIRKLEWTSASPPLRFPGDNHLLALTDAPRTQNIDHEAMGYSPWGGIAIILFSLSAHQTSWDQQSALRETASPLRSSQNGTDDVNKTAKRYGWERASFLGMAGAALVSMGWGLVGFLGVPRGGEKANIFSSLPLNDGWIACARVLVLITLLSTLSFSLHPARVSLLRLFELPFAARGSKADTARLRSRRKFRRGSLESDRTEDSDDPRLDHRAQRRMAWAERGVAVLAWTIVALAAGGLLSGTEAETGEGIASAAEVLGAVGASISGFLLPAAFFVVLFHFRRPRSIVFSRPDAPGVAEDVLLLRKEKQLQKRLSGRRTWQDIGVFALLLPFGLVVLIRSSLLLATR